VPACAGKACGPDGCGGSCGACAAGTLCAGGQCADDPCDPDPCAGNGACDKQSGLCTCKAGFAGKGCSQCAPGLVAYPQCKPDPCLGVTCSGHGACQAGLGTCGCDVGFAGSDCGQCVVADATFPACPDPCKGKNCDDGNPCTTDSCASDGACKWLANTAPCNDGDVCTANDQCAAGACMGGSKACDLAVTATGDSDDGNCTVAHCTLREAIAAANANANATGIGFAVDAGIVLGAALPDITAPLTIDGLGRKVTIDAGKKFRVFEGKAELTLKNMTVMGGAAIGGSGNGGAVQGIGGLVTAVHVLFRNNSAGYGGAIAADGAVLVGCTFDGNESLGSGKAGGAVALAGASTVTDCTFSDNKAAGDGGGLAVFFGGLVQVTRSSFIKNQSGGNGGGLACAGACIAANSTFSDNAASKSGGNVFASAKAELVHCSLVGGSAAEGAGLASAADLALTNTWIGGGKGGGSDCKATPASVTGSWTGDGSCGCGQMPADSFGALGAWGGLTPTVNLPAGSTLIDGATDAGCAHPLVAGVDQRGLARPAGTHCDVGALEQTASPCADLAATATCSDGNACTLGDVCKAGACKGADTQTCDDGNACTDDMCSPSLGCKHTANSAGCDDGNPCTTKDTCAAASCAGVTANCDDANGCTADYCAAGVGCQHSAMTGSCSDGEPCTAADHCAAGKCVAGPKVCVLPTVAGLVGRWAADAPDSVSATEGSVTAWQDLTGKGHVLTAAGPGQGPVVDKLGVFGRPALNFGGGKGLALSNLDLGSEATIFVVLRAAPASANAAVAHHGNKDTDWSLRYSSGGDSLRMQSANDATGVALPVQAGQSYVVTARISPASRGLWTTTSTTSAKTGGTSTIVPGSKTFYVGRSDSGEASNAVIGEILYYNKALSDDDVQTVLAYLRTAWAFAAPKPNWAWYDASDSATLIYGNVKKTDNSEIAAWNDKSGLDRHAKSTVPPLLAATPGGKASLGFSVDQRMTVATPLAATTQMSVFAVFKASPGASPGRLAGVTGGAFALEAASATCDGCAPELRWMVGGKKAVAATFAADKWQVLSLVHDKVNAALAIGGNAPASAVVSAIAGNAETFVLGNSSDGSAPINGAVAELRIFGHAVSASDRAVIDAELRVKWGL